jgi:uncharacterized OsmC-like protein
MSTADIAQRLSTVRGQLTRHPEAATQDDTGVTATVTSGFRVDVTDDAGRMLATDMPAMIGGSGSAATPGTLWRAAIAACDATTLAMVAAEDGIALAHVEVRVDSRSDYRGLLGVDDHGEAVAPGPLEFVIRYRISAPGVDPERVRALVAGIEARSPVGSALRQIAPVRKQVDLVPPGEPAT